MKTDFLVSLHDQADHITQVYARQGNHRLAELRRSFCNGVDFPEFKRSEGWINDALTLLPRMIDDDVYDDGMNRELVFSYHTMYIGIFLDAYNLFRQHGYEKRLPPTYYPKLLKMAEIYAMQSFPDFTSCQFGDAWKAGDTGAFFRRQLAPFASDMPYFDYMASNGKNGSPPARRSAAYPESGFYFFRSAWSPDAVFMPLKCGATAEWHNQPDNGTFELFAYGRNLMTDSGCYLYGSTSPEEQRWRAWFRGTKVHQTLTLDNRNISCKPTCLLWSETTNLVALVVENQSYPGLKHRRTVLHRYRIKPDHVCVEDIDAPRVLKFLEDLECRRGNSARTRNQRRAAIRSFLRHATAGNPLLLPLAQRVLAIPSKRFERASIGYLTPEQMQAILDSPDLLTESGERDRLLLMLLYNTGAGFGDRRLEGPGRSPGITLIGSLPGSRS